MKVAIITVAGISSRFNEGIPENEKCLKAIYTETDAKDTLLYHLLDKCSFADRIVLVGGYKYDDLYGFFVNYLSEEFRNVVFVKNEHYDDLSSGYSLYLGIKESEKYNPDEILFVEGDLDIDNTSFTQVINTQKNVLTYTSEPIFANKAVVLYEDGDGNYKYAFNSSHGLLNIEEPVSCILNSGQVWKFINVKMLFKANEVFGELEIDGTNLRIIQRYVESIPYESLELMRLIRWVNCNTREDYRKIVKNWRNEK